MYTCPSANSSKGYAPKYRQIYFKKYCFVFFSFSRCFWGHFYRVIKKIAISMNFQLCLSAMWRCCVTIREYIGSRTSRTTYPKRFTRHQSARYETYGCQRKFGLFCSISAFRPMFELFFRPEKLRILTNPCGFHNVYAFNYKVFENELKPRGADFAPPIDTLPLRGSHRDDLVRIKSMFIALFIIYILNFSYLFLFLVPIIQPPIFYFETEIYSIPLKCVLFQSSKNILVFLKDFINVLSLNGFDVFLNC